MSGKFWSRAWSLVDGCTPVSAGCANCWLEKMTRFDGRDFSQVTFREDRLDIPLRAKKPTVFAIWSDLYHEAVTFEQIVMAYVAMAAASQHTFLIVTKRPERAAQWHRTFKLEDVYNEWYSVCATHGPCAEDWPLPNVYHLVTVENQEMADERIPHALKIPGKVGLLIEPMLGPVDLYYWLGDPGHCCPQCGIPIIRGTGNSYDDERRLLKYCVRCNHEFGTWEGRISGVILGGETGPKARPMHPDWARSVRDQCEVAGVPFFFKSWGEWGVTGTDDVPPDTTDFSRWVCADSTDRKRIGSVSYQAATGEKVTSGPLVGWKKTYRMQRIGSKKAGRLLDGREHNELPWATRPIGEGE